MMGGCRRRPDGMMLVTVVGIVALVGWELCRVANGRAIREPDAGSVLEERAEQEQRLQQAAFQAFTHRRTGQVYSVPSPLPPGSAAEAVRLRSGSLRRYGLLLRQFNVPPACRVLPAVQRVMLVYESVRAASRLFPVNGYVIVAPVIGLSVYDASNLGSMGLAPKLSLLATFQNISVHLQPNRPLPVNVTTHCAYFSESSLQVSVSNRTSSGACLFSHLGFFSLIARLPPPTSPSSISVLSAGRTRQSRVWEISVGATIGALVLLVLSGMAIGCAAAGYRRHRMLAAMEEEADLGEALQVGAIRGTRTPTAGATRTRPILEDEYATRDAGLGSD